MGRRRAWTVAIWVGNLAAAAIVADCGGSSPPEQSGTQRLTGRDFGNLFFWNEQTPAFTRQTTTPGSPSQDFWIWPEGENAPSLALSEIAWSPPYFSDRLITGDILMTNAYGNQMFGVYADQVYDLQARTSLNLETVVPSAASGAGVIDWGTIRRDGGAVLAHRQSGDLLAGRGSAFAFLPPSYAAVGADFMGDDLAVLASASSDPQRQQVYRMALPSADVSPLPVSPFYRTFPTCYPYQNPPCRTFRVVGCSADDAICPETGRPPCAILYVRPDSTTAVGQPYVFDVNSGQETALPGSNPDEFVLSPDQHSAAWLNSAGDTSNGSVPAEATPIYVHNFCSGAAVQGSLPQAMRIEWRRDGGELIVGLADYRQGLIDVPTGTSSLLGAGTIEEYAFSPAGDRLAWTQADIPNDVPPQLWIGDAAGGGSRMLADTVFEFTFSPDGQALYITHASGGEYSLSWLSLAADSPPEQLIAQPFSDGILRGNQRALVIDHWNSQDGSGNLTLVELPSSARQVLAHSVTDVAIAGSVDGAARVLYAVRGRFASAQDGLWETTLPAP